MSFPFFRQAMLLGWVLLAVALGDRAWAGEAGQRFEATLVWGTNEAEAPGSVLKPVPAAVARKLAKLPFKWTYYYSVERKEFALEKGERTKVRMSQECEITVKAVDAETVELTLRGRGQPVGKVTQKLCGSELLVTGGNAENFTAWFVVLRRLE
jgi:hypothetical protein